MKERLGYGAPRYLVGLFLSLTILAIFVPLTPTMPRSGLDLSWAFGLNQAVSQHFVFGKDIVFTFGPYASIYTRVFHPATDHLMIWGSLLLGLGYSFMVLLLARGAGVLWLAVLALYLASLMYSRDALIFSYPFVLALVVYRITLPGNHAGRLETSRLTMIWGIVIFSFLGLLPLIKGTLLLVVAATAVLCSFLLWHCRQKALAFLAAVAPVISAATFWALSGQPIEALPAFIINMGEIVSGYTEAMAVTGNLAEVFLYAAAAVAILYTAVSDRSAPIISRVFLFLTCALFLFVSFKNGFVRHDAHALIGATAIALTALLLLFAVRGVAIIVALLVTAYAWSDIVDGYVRISPDTVYAQLKSTYANAWRGLHIRIAGGNELKKEFENQLLAIRKELTIPHLPGTMDIYSYGQAYLLASENAWSPRPVLQSYSAYTPSLARLNERHLRGITSPDNLMFRIEPTDGRLPAIEDGLSWPVIINNYTPDKLIEDYILFKKRTSMQQEDRTTEVSIAMHSLYEEVALPKTKVPLFAEIDIRPTLLGRTLSLMYKLLPLTMTLTLADGSKRSYRIVSGMVKIRFLISPHIENTRDFLILTGHGNAPKAYLAIRAVKSINIYPSDWLFEKSWSSWIWETSYTMKLTAIDLLRDADLETFDIFGKIIDRPQAVTESSVACEGSIDVVNGVTLPSTALTISGMLDVNGWTAIEGRKGTVPDTIYVTLADENGHRFFITTYSTPRDDVKKYFNQPQMPDVGFSAFVDISKLRGRYVLGLSRVFKGKLEHCNQFALPLQIMPTAAN
jgi:hypothetical protein